MTTTAQRSDGTQTYKVVDVTAAYTIDKDDCPILIVNTSAAGAVAVTLPQDAKAGSVVTAVATVAQVLDIESGTAGAIYASNGTTFAKQTDDRYVRADGIGDQVTLVADGNGDWIAINQGAMAQAATVGFQTVG